MSHHIFQVVMVLGVCYAFTKHISRENLLGRRRASARNEYTKAATELFGATVNALGTTRTRYGEPPYTVLCARDGCEGLIHSHNCIRLNKALDAFWLAATNIKRIKEVA